MRFWPFRRRALHPQIVITAVGSDLRVTCNLPDLARRTNDEVVEAANYLAAATYVMTGGSAVAVAQVQQAVAVAATRRDDKFFSDVFHVALNGVLGDGGRAAEEDRERDRSRQPAVRASETFGGGDRD